MGDEAPPRWWGEEGARPRPDPAGWWPEADTLHWVQAPATASAPAEAALPS